jgi:gas vesicle protein
MSKKEDKKATLKRLAVMSSLAAAAGFMAGVLTAPKSGKGTRADIKKAADVSYAQAEKELKKLNVDLTKLINEAKDQGEKIGSKAQKELGDILDKAKDTKEKGREVLSALHEGSAEDKDLTRAIKDANLALTHLKDFLKK